MAAWQTRRMAGPAAGRASPAAECCSSRGHREPVPGCRVRPRAVEPASILPSLVRARSGPSFDERAWHATELAAEGPSQVSLEDSPGGRSPSCSTGCSSALAARWSPSRRGSARSPGNCADGAASADDLSGGGPHTAPGRAQSPLARRPGVAGSGDREAQTRMGPAVHGRSSRQSRRHRALVCVLAAVTSAAAAQAAQAAH